MRQLAVGPAAWMARVAQGTPVQFAVGRQWQLIQDGDGGGHQVPGQAAGQDPQQLIGIHGLSAGPRDEGRELLSPGGLTGHHRGLSDGGAGEEGVLDLAWLDPVPLDLDLEVLAAEELDVAARQVASEVAGAVERAPR